MPSNSYDLVVLGDDLAALVCATLCARRGMRTLVLGDDRPARYTLGPHKLPVEPVLWPVGAGTPGERVLKELHAELALRRKLREPKIAAQLVAPDLRIDLGADRLAGELAREIGGAADSWVERWSKGADVARTLDPLLGADIEFPPLAGFFKNRDTTKLVEKVAGDAAAWWKDTEGQRHARVWRHLAAIMLRHPDATPAAIARAIDQWRAGPAALRGDAESLRELLVEKLSTAGGEVRSGKVAELVVSWSKITSLVLVNGDDIGAGQVVSSRPPAELAALLGKKAPKRLAELAEGSQVIGYRYVLNVVIDEAGLPEHMAPTVAVVAAPDEDPVGDAAFSIHVGETDDSGRVVATVAAVLPTDGAVEAERIMPKVSALRARLWNRLAEVMPFFDRHLVLAHSPHEPTPPQVPGGRGSYDVPRNLPVAMVPVWRGGGDEAVDAVVGGTMTYATGLKNLTLTGDQMLPVFGLEGALTAGWSAAKVVCGNAGKKKDYLQNEVVGVSS